MTTELETRVTGDPPVGISDLLAAGRIYYEDAFATIYHGDCLEIMRGMANSFDAIITDPPYCSGGYLEAQKTGAKAQGLRGATVAADDFTWFVNDNMSTQGLMWLLRNLVGECRRVLKPNRSMFIFTDWRMMAALTPAMESAGVRYRNTLIWDKGNAGLGVGFKPAYEVILEFSKGQTEYYRKDGQNLLRVPRVHASEKEHGAQKPVKLLQQIMQQVMPPNGCVLDPFSGSGSTPLAAKELGFRAVGIECEESHCETIARRLAQGVLWRQNDQLTRDDGQKPHAATKGATK